MSYICNISIIIIDIGNMLTYYSIINFIFTFQDMIKLFLMCIALSGCFAQKKAKIEYAYDKMNETNNVYVDSRIQNDDIVKVEEPNENVLSYNRFDRKQDLEPIKHDISKPVNLITKNFKYESPVHKQNIIDVNHAKNNIIMINAKQDSEVLSISNGVVVFAGHKEGFGNLVIIDHKDNTMSAYGNLSDINVSKNQKILELQAVGFSGSSPVYFSIKQNKISVNPTTMIDFSHGK
jgi:murein DD-endopeptidase MepM/ murein hydrolase activator NlpD